MNINPFKLFDPSYLFDWRPGSEFLYRWPLIVLFVALFAGSFWVARQKSSLRGLASRMREFSVLGLALAFFRDQNIPYLGARIWLVLLFVAALVYGIWYWKEMEKQADLKPAMKEKADHLEKYLPRKKKR